MVIGVISGLSYAYWRFNATQKGINKVTSDCLNLKFTEKNEGILLEKSFPIRDEEAKKLIPYTFTIENKCNVSVAYDINLEILDNSLQSEYIAVEINDNGKRYLDSYRSVTSTYQEGDQKALEARKLLNGTLSENETKEYSIRLWIDEKVTADDDVMNKTFKSKISVVGSIEEVTQPETELQYLVKLGDYVSMTPTKSEYTITSELTGYSSNQTINPSELNLWRVIRINPDGSIDMVSEYTSSMGVAFVGETGYKNSVGVLNAVASTYTNSDYTIGSRYLGYNGQTEFLQVEHLTTDNLDKESNGAGENLDTGSHINDLNLIQKILNTKQAYPVNQQESEKTAEQYWVAGRGVIAPYDSDYHFDALFSLYTITANGDLRGISMHGFGGESTSQDFGLNTFLKLRPIVTLKPNLTAKSGDGKSASTAWQFE